MTNSLGEIQVDDCLFASTHTLFRPSISTQTSVMDNLNKHSPKPALPVESTGVRRYSHCTTNSRPIFDDFDEHGLDGNEVDDSEGLAQYYEMNEISNRSFTDFPII